MIALSGMECNLVRGKIRPAVTSNYNNMLHFLKKRISPSGLRDLKDIVHNMVSQKLEILP